MSNRHIVSGAILFSLCQHLVGNRAGGTHVLGDTDGFCSSILGAVEIEASIVNGAFLWDHQMASEEMWARSIFESQRSFSTRDKLFEKVVRETYARWK